MKRFKNILLSADTVKGAKPLIKRAVDLAKNNKAKLTIVQVETEIPDELKSMFASLKLGNVKDIVIQERLKMIKESLKPIHGKGVSPQIKVFFGTPFIEIIREVLRKKHDLVIREAEGNGGMSEVLFGSTTMSLLRKCPCPVWVIKPTRARRFSRILAAVQPDPSDRIKDALNTKIIQLASSLAASEKGELHVINAWRLYGESLLKGRARVSKEDINKMLSDTQRIHREWLERLLQKHSPNIPKKNVHFLKGMATKLIPSFAEKRKVDLIVMGTLGRTGVHGLLMGNTAERVLQQVNCSVLTVKPDEFVSPVTLK